MTNKVKQLQVDLRTTRTKADVLEDLSKSLVWDHNEHPEKAGDDCDVCGKTMPVNILTALFGVHKDCWKKENEATG